MKSKIKNNKIFVKCKNKKYNIFYLLSQIKRELKLENNIKFCWKNKKGTVKKYNNNFIKKCEEYLIDEKKLTDIFKR